MPIRQIRLELIDHSLRPLCNCLSVRLDVLSVRFEPARPDGAIETLQHFCTAGGRQERRQRRPQKQPVGGPYRYSVAVYGPALSGAMLLNALRESPGTCDQSERRRVSPRGPRRLRAADIATAASGTYSTAGMPLRPTDVKTVPRHPVLRRQLAISCDETPHASAMYMRLRLRGYAGVSRLSD